MVQCPSFIKQMGLCKEATAAKAISEASKEQNQSIFFMIFGIISSFLFFATLLLDDSYGALQERAVGSFFVLITVALISKKSKKAASYMIVFQCIFSPIIILITKADPMFILGGWHITLPSITFLITQNLTMLIFHSFLFAIVALCLKPTLQSVCYQGDTVKLNYMLADGFLVMLIITITTWQFYRITMNTQKRLEEAKDKAEDSSRRLKMFLQSFSHELRNPLNSLSGNLDLALMELDSQTEVRQYIKTAKTCTHALLQLINNILDSGKEDVGILEVENKKTNIRQILTQLWDIYSLQIREKKLQGQITIKTDLPEFLTSDSMRLTQVLTNFLSNALKFTTKGAIKIGVEWLPHKTDVHDDTLYSELDYDVLNIFSCGDQDKLDDEESYSSMAVACENIGNHTNKTKVRKESLQQTQFESLSFAKKHFKLKPFYQSCEDTQGILRIVITDTGEGISNENQKQIFTKFSQFSQDLTTRNMGTGLGLYITKRIIDRLNGSVKIRSQAGIGTQFICCLPASYHFEPPVLKPNPMHIIHESKPRLSLDSASMKSSFLIVDDSVFNLNLMEKYVLKYGGEVVGKAMNGKQALEMYIDMPTKPEYILTDVDMPVMNGLEFCKKVRDYERQKKITFNATKVIVVSGNAPTHTSHLAGYNEYIMKPISFENFSQSIKKAKKNIREQNVGYC